MELVGAVVVFLLGASVGLLVALYLLAARAERGARFQADAEAERAEEREHERREHLNATAAIVVEMMRLVGAGLAAEIRQTATQQRNDLRLVVGLPAVEVPVARRPRRTAPRATPPAGTPAVPSPTAAAPGVWTVGDDEPTPPSGWTLEEVRERSQRGLERAP